MPNVRLAGLILASCFGIFSTAAQVTESPRLPDIPRLDGSLILPTGWSLRPVGKHIELPGDLPLKMAFSDDKKLLYVVTGGFHNHGVSVIDVQSQTLVQTIGLPNAWAGLAVDGKKLYVSGGLAKIRTFSTEPTLTRGDDIGGSTPLREHRSLFKGGLIKTGDALFVASTSTDEVLKMAGTPEEVVARVKVGYHPYSLALSPDGKTLAASNWGDTSVSLIDLNRFSESKRVVVGIHPNELIYGLDGRLFVANAGSNSVSVIAEGQVRETIRTSLKADDLVGSTPDALALSPDGKTLFVANADNNSVAVVDVSKSESRIKGFIPTGWYPTSLAVTPDGKQLLVGVGKGLGFYANETANTKIARQTYDHKFRYDYIGGLLKGFVSFVNIPSDSQLKNLTHQVAISFPSPAKAGVSSKETRGITKNVFSKIKHVLYVIRENRTYDQVFGDEPRGNGEPRIVMFGKKVTPNAHALASKFVLLDNTYCSGEVSEDGHQWCNAAYATHFTERAWENSYSGHSEPDADERLTASPAGYLWDKCRKKGLDYYSYGEFASFRSTPDHAPEYNGTPGLDGHASLAWSQAGDRDTDRLKVFLDDLKGAEKTGKWHDYMVMSFGEDHTHGLSSGSFTPWACVASNDQALGKMVDAISHSRFWKDTAIFVIEDDAQDGPDHVDAHRTVALVVSPYTKRNHVDSTMYTTVGMLKTMELILGLDPMTQFDETATPMVRSFTDKPNFEPYTALPPETDVNAKNGTGPLSRASSRLDFSGYDRANPQELNRILWEATHPGVPMPAPVRSARVSG